MTDEERQRLMDFLLEQQAHADTRLSRLEEQRERDEVNQQRHEEAMRRIEAAQEVTAQQVQHLGGAMIELAEAQARTEERLNALINTVERHIGEGRP